MPEKSDNRRSSGGESFVTVLIALAANALIAVAKSFVAAITGSASMVAEAAHSWADTGNEVFLVLAEKKSDRPPDRTHPLGYGREAYVWSMFAAFGLFIIGAVISIGHGIQDLLAKSSGEEPRYGWAFAVLGVSFVLEGISFLRALKQTRGEAESRGLRPMRYLARTSNPTLRAVFAEDSAALMGIILAATGIGLHDLTGDKTYDAAGSIAVGVLLACVALYLIDRNRDFLTGESVSPGVRDRTLAALLDMDEVDRVTFLHLEYIGPGRVFLVAAIDLSGNHPEDRLADLMHSVERRLTEYEAIEQAVLTLSAPGDEALTPESSGELKTV